MIPMRVETCVCMWIQGALLTVYACVCCLADAAARTFVLAPPRIALVAGVSMYCCSACSHQSKYKSQYDAHARTHTGERPCACDMCGYTCSLSQAGNLKAHLRTHSGEKPFACEECPATFSQASKLKTHMRTHTGEKPFACELKSVHTSAPQLAI